MTEYLLNYELKVTASIKIEANTPEGARAKLNRLLEQYATISFYSGENNDSESYEHNITKIEECSQNGSGEI